MSALNHTASFPFTAIAGLASVPCSGCGAALIVDSDSPALVLCRSCRKSEQESDVISLCQQIRALAEGRDGFDLLTIDDRRVALSQLATCRRPRPQGHAGRQARPGVARRAGCHLGPLRGHGGRAERGGEAGHLRYGREFSTEKRRPRAIGGKVMDFRGGTATAPVFFSPVQFVHRITRDFAPVPCPAVTVKVCHFP
jgi:hypothetical protein